jgi:ATP-binding protein involved in chromosome partitioning
MNEQTSIQITEDVVLNELRSVKDPDLHKDIVALNMIRDVKICGGIVSFRFVLTTPACPVRDQLKFEAERTVMAVPGVERVEVKMDAEVPKARGALDKAEIAGVKHIIAVSSGKGGVGKSTVAVNLAVSLGLMGAKVGILDTDVYGPNVPIMMGGKDMPNVRGEMIVPPVYHGVKTMSIGLLNPGDKAVVWRGPMLHSAVSQFLRQVEWGELDYLVVDMPPGTGDVQLSLAQLVPVAGAVLVTTPQEVALSDVRKAYNMFDQLRVPILGIVENMSYFECPNDGESSSSSAMAAERRWPKPTARRSSGRSRSRSTFARAATWESPSSSVGPTALRRRRSAPSRKTWPRRSASRR